MINTQLRQQETKTNLGHSISFPKGLIGFDGLQQFTLEPLFEDKSTDLPFLRLQAKGQETNFIIMPMGNPFDTNESNPYLPGEIMPHLEQFGVEENKFSMFALVAIKNNKDGCSVTANLRAPLIIDFESMHAWQVILDNPAYDIAFDLNAE